MGVHITGECLGVTRENRSYTDSEGRHQTFEAVTIHLIEPGGVEPITAEPVRDFRGALPTKGELVALDVYINARKSKAGNAYQVVKAAGRNEVIEAALYDALTASSK